MGRSSTWLIDLFDEEGSWRRPRRCCSNFLVIEDRGDGIDSVVSLTTYSIDSGEHRELPIAVEAPLGVFRASATFRCAGAKTSILRLDLRPELTIGKPNCHR
jgi:hypothetical protein